MLEKVGSVFFVGASVKLLLGVGIVLAAPVALTMLRPATKQIVKGGVHVADKLKRYATRSGEPQTVAVDTADAKTRQSQTTTDAAPVEITANVTVNLNPVDFPPTERPPAAIELSAIGTQDPD